MCRLEAVLLLCMAALRSPMNGRWWSLAMEGQWKGLHCSMLSHAEYSWCGNMMGGWSVCEHVALAVDASRCIFLSLL